jgi:hypothetical protein
MPHFWATKQLRMRKNILVFGLVSGLILIAWTLCFTILSKYLNGDLDNAVAGYTAMIIAFSLIFVAIRNFRDKYNQGVVTFGQAFRIGLGISLIGSTFYVGAWLIEYYCYMPDFMDKYSAGLISQAQHSGLSAAALDKRIAEINSQKAAYKNPIIVILYTYLEVLPVGLVISLITALILKRRKTQTTIINAIQ